MKAISDTICTIVPQNVNCTAAFKLPNLYALLEHLIKIHCIPNSIKVVLAIGHRHLGFGHAFGQTEQHDDLLA